MITSFFKKLSREETELQNLKEFQISRTKNDQKRQSEASAVTRAAEVNRISSVISQEVIEIDDEDVGDLVFTGFQRMLSSTVVESTNVERVNKRKRAYSARPSNWKDITLHFMTYKNQASTMRSFGLNLDKDAGSEAKTKNYCHWGVKLNRWAKQFHKRGDDDFKKTGKHPPYGKEIDDELASIVRNYNKHGVPMTDNILRCCLIELLAKRRPDLTQLIAEPYNSLQETSKKYKFGQSWAQRFWKRHGLRSRVATTKMRNDLPANYEEKVTVFENVLSLAIHKHNVPDELIVALDETNTQFVPSVKRTRVERGTKRVRVVGVGHEKPQITVTIVVSATGSIIEPTQSIYGGKTNTCLPNKGKTVPPTGQYFDKTPSHWQTPESFAKLILKTLIPYKHEMVERKGLRNDQKMILILDLHYSHKDSSILTLLTAHDIIPIYVPAGCTDAHQVLDVVVNKPYKNGVAAGFTDYTSKLYEEWKRTKTDEDDCFKMNLALSSMKPLIPSFVERGINAIKTDKNEIDDSRLL
jgi:hypothetical protein